jgi:hypothetical protein
MPHAEEFDAEGLHRQVRNGFLAKTLAKCCIKATRRFDAKNANLLMCNNYETIISREAAQNLKRNLNWKRGEMRISEPFPWGEIPFLFQG